MSKLLALLNLGDNTTLPRLIGTIYVTLSIVNTTINDVLLPALVKLMEILGIAPPVS